MHFAFVVRASADIGIGHLMRCMALAQAVLKKNHQVTFLLDYQTQEIAQSRSDWCGEVVTSDYHITVEEQISQLVDKQFISDWIVIDGYAFGYDYCHAWQNAGYKVALFDDGVHHSPYGVDILINPSTGHAIAEDGTPIMCGYQYRLLREEFAAIKQQAVQQRQYLTLAFGGSDPANVTIPLLALLHKAEFNAPIRVITGPAYPYLEDLKIQLNKCSLKVEHIHASENMAEIWSETKLAVSAAGGSQFELAVCSTPSILVVVAKNQLQASANAAQEGWCVVADLIAHSQRGRNLADLCNSILELWNDEQGLKEMYNSVRGKYDAMGAHRVVNGLIDYG